MSEVSSSSRSLSLVCVAVTVFLFLFSVSRSLSLPSSSHPVVCCVSVCTHIIRRAMAENLHQPFSSDEGEIIFQSDAVLKEETKDDILWESSFTNDLTAENDEIDAPAEFKRSKDKNFEKFWKTRFSHKKSTFGTSSLRTVLDRPTHYGWDMADAAVKWQVHNDHGQRHGRVRLNTTLGCFVSTPGVGQYDPNDNLHKRRVRTSRLVSRLDEPRKDYTTPAPNAHNIIRTMDPSHIQKQMIGSEWKEGLTFTKSFENPGPGTHETPLVSSKHERFPVARLATRSPHRPRTTLAPDLTVLDKYDVDVCDPVGDRWENPPPGQYEVSVDIGKSRKARTIGERQPLLEQKGKFRAMSLLCRVVSCRA